MKYLTIPFLLSLMPLLPNSVMAQHKNDFNWIIGSPKLDLVEKFGGMKMNFFTPEPEFDIFYLPTEMALDIACISDSSGQLQFYTNGCKILNAAHQVIENGDSLNYPSKGYQDACRYNLSYDLFRGVIALPEPGTNKRYVLFHLQQNSTDQAYFPQSILYSLVDMSANNGAGAVLQKNMLLAEEIFSDMLAAVKHGNGRDWWIAAPLVGSDKIGMFLLSPYGIKGPEYKPSPVIWTGRADLYEVTFAIFSPDGKKYARFGNLNGLHLYDFDRCTGEFSCPVTIDFPNDTVWVAGVCFSPNNRFLYVVTGLKVYQFDTWEKDIEASKVLVGKYDEFKAPLETVPFQPLLAPNGKIYLSSANGAYVLHTIHNPNEKGLACRFVNHDLFLPTQNGFCLPNFPNFRLYDWAGSPCDSVGVDAPGDTLRTFWFGDKPSLSPNPASDFTLVTVSHCINGTMSVYDAIGRSVYELQNIRKAKYDIDVSLWPAGIYMVVVRGEGKKVWTSKLVVAR